MAVGVSAWSCVSGSSVALTASTVKTVLGIKADSTKSCKLTELGVAMDATDATKGPVLVQLVLCTWASNSPGTNSTSVTPVLVSGRGVADEISAAHTWTTEPTAVTSVIREWFIDSNKGQLIVQFPMGREPEAVVAEGFALRCTSGASSTPNVRAYMEIET